MVVIVMETTAGIGVTDTLVTPAIQRWYAPVSIAIVSLPTPTRIALLIPVVQTISIVVTVVEHIAWLLLSRTASPVSNITLLTTTGVAVLSAVEDTACVYITHGWVNITSALCITAMTVSYISRIADTHILERSAVVNTARINITRVHHIAALQLAQIAISRVTLVTLTHITT